MSMEKYKLTKSIVNDDLFKLFTEKKGDSIYMHSVNCCSIDDFLSIAYILCPRIIEVKGYLFIADFFDTEEKGEAIKKVERLEKQFNYNKVEIEKWVNAWSLGEFFLGKPNKTLDVDDVFDEFGKVLAYYWRRWVKEVYPDRNIIIELGDDIMGEWGPSITMYEKVL